MLAGPRRGGVAQHSRAQGLITFAVPDFGHRLFQNVAQDDAFIVLGGKWGNATRQRGPVGGDIHEVPRSHTALPGVIAFDRNALVRRRCPGSLKDQT